MTSRDLLVAAAGAAVLWVVIERWRHRSIATAVAAGEVAPAIAAGEPVAGAADDDGPESDGAPCCAACSGSSSSSFWRGCDGAGDVIIPGKTMPVVYPVVLTAPPLGLGANSGHGIGSADPWIPATVTPTAGTRVRVMHPRVTADHRGEVATHVLSRTGATISRVVDRRTVLHR
jgi:hypothetical protein